MAKHQAPRSTDAAVSELRALADQGRLIQLAHDISLLMGAKCRCGERHDEHEHDPEKPQITKE